MTDDENDRPTVQLSPVAQSPQKAIRRQILLYAPPPALAAPMVSLLEAEGFDVLVAVSPDNAAILLENGSPSLIFALVPALGPDLREIFRKHAPNTEIRVISGIGKLIEEAVIPPGEAFAFALRAIVATAGVLSASRGTPRERAVRIFQLVDRAVLALGYPAADAAAARLAAALFDVPGALMAPRTPSDETERSDRNRDLHRQLLAEFIDGLQSPLPATSPSSANDSLPSPLQLVDAAAEYALSLEERVPNPSLRLRKLAAGGELNAVAVEAIIGASAREATSRGRRVLIVDPDAAARTMLALRLTNEGYETHAVGDGRTALELIRTDPPALVLSEVVLPGLDGYAMLDTMKRGGFGTIPVVFLSSRSDAASTNKGLLLGAADFLAKPINSEVLLTRLQKLMGESVRASEASSRLALSDLTQGTSSSFDAVTYAQLQPGVKILGRFQLIDALGEGGMGKVFKARDEKLEEDVVLKVMKDSLTGDPRTLSHFKREIRLARRISHPAVVRIFDFWEADPLKFVTMEYLQGTDLANEIHRRGAFPIPVTVRLSVDLFEGLAAAHDLGVVHRDIKPHNLFLTASGQLKILDFGIAQGLDPSGPDAATQTHSIIGTPDYMSPEQLLGQKLDQRTDLYSAGVVVYELLIGRLPFHADTRNESITMRLHKTVEAPSHLNPRVSPQLDEILLRLLDRDTRHRYADARSVATALRAIRGV